MTNAEYVEAVAKWQKHYKASFYPFMAAEPETITHRDIELAFAEHDQYHRSGQ